MKINLLREDQMSKVPHQDKEEEILRFDDTFSNGNDDLYFQQPTPPSEEYRRPHKSRIWLFILLLLVFLIVGAFISNPSGTKNFFANFADNTVQLWRKGTDKIQIWWLHRNDKDIAYVTETPDIPVRKEEPAEPKKDIVQQRIIKIEKIIEKEVVKETVEEKVVESPPIYDTIRDELALSKRNMDAAEFVWSKIPGGMTLDRLQISEDRLSVSVKSRYPMLIQSYANVIEQNDMFTSVYEGEQELIDEQTRVQLTTYLPAFKLEDRPTQIWDLDIEWFDDYLNNVSKSADVNISQEIRNTRTLDDKILRHDVHVTVSGNRTSMMLLFQELKTIPAAYVVQEIESKYHPENQSNVLELNMVYYERK